MSRHHVMMIEQPAATAFLFDDVGRRQGNAAAGFAREIEDRGVWQQRRAARIVRSRQSSPLSPVGCVECGR